MAKGQIRAEVTFYTNNYYDKSGRLIHTVDAQVRYRDTATGRLTKSTTGQGSQYYKGINAEIAGRLQKDLSTGRKSTAQVAGILGSWGTKNASYESLRSARDSFLQALSERAPLTDNQRKKITFLLQKLDHRDFEEFYRENQYLIERMWEMYDTLEGRINPDQQVSLLEWDSLVDELEDSLMKYNDITSKTQLRKSMRGYDPDRDIHWLPERPKEGPKERPKQSQPKARRRTK